MHEASSKQNMLFDTEDGGVVFLRNVYWHSTVYMALCTEPFIAIAASTSYPTKLISSENIIFSDVCPMLCLKLV
jgi:hypothetical protein